jgi:hypothetical protein
MALLILGLTLLPLGGAARGDSVTHVLSDQESLETVAQHYYGDASWADGLRRYNALELTDPLAGTLLVVPMPSPHLVVRGDSWESLAARYWDDAGLAESLSEWSDALDGELLPGQEIRIPVLLPHGLRPGESLAALSRRLTGGPDRAAALAALNRIDEPRRLAVGQVVRVPILGTPAVGATLPEPQLEAAEPLATPVQPPAMTEAPDLPVEPLPVAEAMKSPTAPEESAGFEAELRHVDAAFREGDFERARELLEALRPVVLAEGSSREQRRLLYQLTAVYAAFDEVEPLCTSYRALRALDPSFEWDPDLTSPKIILLSDRCAAID